MGKLVWFLARLEPVIVSILSRSVVFSDDEKKSILEDFHDVQRRFADGVVRTRQAQLSEVTSPFPDKKMFELDDISLRVKLKHTEDDLLYFVSVTLTSIERLYLTNHLTEKEYERYRGIVRYLPKLRDELVDRMEFGQPLVR